MLLLQRLSKLASTRRFRESIVPLVLLCGAAFLLFANTFGNAWTMDDLPVIVNNPDIRSLSAFFHDTYPGRPLRELTYLLDYKLFALDPTGYHIQNILWHGLNCFLLFILTIRLTGNRLVAWSAALLFLAHPIHVEVVANISHRKDSLALAFILLSMIAYMQLFRTDARRGIWFLASVTAWGISLTAKQNAIVLPLMFCTYELCCIPLEQRYLLQSRRWTNGLAAAISVGVIAWFAQLGWNSRFMSEVAKVMSRTVDCRQMTVHDYYGMVMKSVTFLLSKFIYPVDLSMEYVFTVPPTWFDPWVVVAMLLLIGMIIALWLAWIYSRVAFLAISWTLLFLLPTSNLFWPTAYFAADRYLYTPSVGLCILTALLLGIILDSALSIQVLVMVCLLACLSLMTWEQNKVWRSQFTLYRHILNASPLSSAGLLGLGAAFQDRGELNEAMACFEKAQNQFPDNAMVYNHLGVIHMLNNDMGKASACFLKAIALNPDFAEAHSNLGLVYETLGDQEKALASLQQSLYINPGNNRAYTNMGMLYEKMGCYDDAEKMHRRALEECGSYADAHYNLGVALCKSGKLVQAREEFCAAVKLAPDHPEALYNAALLALKLGDGIAAVSTLAHLQQLDRGLAEELERELHERNLK